MMGRWAAPLLLLAPSGLQADGGLLARWPLDRDLHDASGNGRHLQGDARLDGRSGGLELPAEQAPRLGTGDFTIALWLHTEASLDDALGDLVTQYDGDARRGFVLGIQTASGVTTCQPNHRTLHFGIDAGTEPRWTDRGRPGNAVYVMALAVAQGELFAGTCEPGSGEAGRVYRLEPDGAAAGATRWVALPPLDGSNAVSTLAEHDGELFAGTAKYRLAGSALPESPNTTPGGRVLRLAAGAWEDCGQLPGTEAVGGLVVFRRRLYASSLYKPAGFFRHEGGSAWTSCGTPGGLRVESLAVHDGFLWASSYDDGRVFRYDGASWTDLGRLGESTQTYSFAVHQGALHVGTWPGGRVYRRDDSGGGRWLDAGRLGEELEVMGMSDCRTRHRPRTMPPMDGGSIAAEVLAAQGVSCLFTLCGGHISPILVGAKRRGLRVIDCRDEATAVFAADATSRLTGRPGVAAVTAGPGLTNTITAVKNAQMAQSAVVLLGGATATLLRGRGSLQDIDQAALLRPHVKWLGRARRVREIVPLLSRAFHAAGDGVPGPVFLELPLDVLYPEAVVRSLHGEAGAGRGEGMAARVARSHIERHVRGLFAGAERALPLASRSAAPPASPHRAPARQVEQVARLLAAAERPVLLLGSQAARSPEGAALAASAIERLGAPVFLSGMARGLLGADHPLQLRHRRKEALREADLVLLAGVPCDFRLGYGRHIARSAAVIAVNLSSRDLTRNRRPRLGVLADPAELLEAVAQAMPAPAAPARAAWLESLRQRDAAREREIQELAWQPSPPVNPLALCRAIDAALPPDSLLVGDGGDFVASASYIVRPRGPLRWLDPGPFGTLGIGAGFALGAKLCRPGAEVWILYGDGSAAYSLMEIDTFVRHGIPVIAVVANDASWQQIARDQVAALGDDVGTVLRRTDYHRVAEGWGGRGLLLDDERRAAEVLAEAQRLARGGEPVVINAHLGVTDLRKGSISL